jgi:hypothetical protein
MLVKRTNARSTLTKMAFNGGVLNWCIANYLSWCMLHNAWSPSSVTHHSWSISHCQWWCGFTIIFMWLSWSFCDAIITWMMTIIIKIIKETKMKNWRLSHPISCWINIYMYIYMYIYTWYIYIGIYDIPSIHLQMFNGKLWDVLRDAMFFTGMFFQWYGIKPTFHGICLMLWRIW